MAILNDKSEELYKFLNSVTYPVMLSDIDMHFNAKGRNWFKDLPKSPLIDCVTPHLQRNKRYVLQPCTLEAFQQSLPGSKTVPSDPVDYITVPRRLVHTKAVYVDLGIMSRETEELQGIIDYATEHYAEAPKIYEDTRHLLLSIEVGAVAILNWLNQVKLDPRYSADDTAYTMFVMEDD